MAFKSLLDPSFTYRSAANTDIRLTFARIRREQREQLAVGPLGELETDESIVAVSSLPRPSQEPRLGSS